MEIEFGGVKKKSTKVESVGVDKQNNPEQTRARKQESKSKQAIYSSFQSLSP